MIFDHTKKFLSKTLLPAAICTVIILAVVSFADGICYAANSEPAIKVGSEVEFPPFAVVDEKGQADGFSVDLIKAVAKAMDLPIVITTGPWDTMWNDLVSGQLDVLPVVAKSPERQRLVDFSLSHTETFDAFFVRDGSPEIHDIKAAHGKKIVVMRSDAAHHALLEYKFQGEIVLVDTIPDGLNMIASGENDAFLCPKIIGILAIKKQSIKGLKAGPLVPDYKRVFSFGVRKGADELREKLNQGLLIVKSSGEYDRIYEKWLGFDDPWRKYTRYSLFTAVVLGIITVAAVFWSAMLRIMVKRRTVELAIKNESLEQEIVNRERIEEELRRHREELELLIEERTRELRSSEVKFRNLFNNSEIGMFRTRIDGSEILDANEKFLKIFGRAREEVIGKPSVIHWADPREREEMVKRLRERGRVAEFECRMLTKKGEVRHCITCLVLYPEQGILEGTITDITARKKFEEQIKDSENRFRGAFENAAVGASMVDLKGRFLKVNRFLCRMLGYSETELLSMTFSDITHPDDIQKGLDNLKKQLEGEADYTSFEKRYICKDGRVLHVIVSPALIRDRHGKPQYFVGLWQDITERKNAENAILESENKFRTMFNSVNDSIAILNLDGKFIEVNKSICRNLGYSREELLRMSPRDIDTTEAAKNVSANIRNIMQKGEHQFESEQITKDGRMISVDISARAIDFEGQKAIIAVCRDITERKKAEEEREKLINELKDALAKVKTLSGMLPICASCKKIRDDKGYWNQIEVYIRDHSQADFTHGLCPECAKKAYEEMEGLK